MKLFSSVITFLLNMEMSILCLHLFLFAVAGAVHVNINYIEDFYWRDYKYDIPPDALPAGKNAMGETTYIGQTLHNIPNGKLIPGPIDPDHKGHMTYAWSQAHYTANNTIKILCSQHPENFVWVATDIDHIKKMPTYDFVPGGYDTSYVLYIGRAPVDGQVVIGKVTITEPYDAFGYTMNGKAYFVKTPFEVLSYKSREETDQGGSKSEGTCGNTKTININIY